MLINLDEYRKAKAAVKQPVPSRDEELLCVNWNPAFGVVALTCFQSPSTRSQFMMLSFCLLALSMRMHAFRPLFRPAARVRVREIIEASPTNAGDASN
jgi:hypothetical protein